MINKLKEIYPGYLILKDKKNINKNYKKYIIVIDKNTYEVHNKTN